jgi:hypothetical protein
MLFSEELVMSIPKSFFYELPVAICLLVLATFVLAAVSAPGQESQRVAALQQAADSIAELASE